MKKEQFFQTMSDGAEIFVNRWIPDDGIQVKGIVQLSHGMVEHSSRYEGFAKKLTDEGFILNAHDHRGHGNTAERAIEQGTGGFGILAEKDGFARVVEDLNEIIKKVKADFPEKKIILFGHSFGSFVAQSYIEKYAENIDECVLCGTRGPNKIEILLGKSITQMICALKGRKSFSLLLKNIMFGSSNKRIPEAKTVSDWLSRDENEVQKYLNDKWCSFNATSGFCFDVFDGLSHIHNSDAMNNIPKTLPIFLIAGDADPIGAYGKTVKKLFEIYKKIGIKNVAMRLYSGARHELLNETNRAEVIQDILQFIKEYL